MTSFLRTDHLRRLRLDLVTPRPLNEAHDLHSPFLSFSAPSRMPLLPLFLLMSSSALELVSLLFLSLFLRSPSPSHGHLPWFWIQAASSVLFMSEAPATRGHPMLGHPELGTTPPHLQREAAPPVGVPEALGSRASLLLVSPSPPLNYLTGLFKSFCN